MALFLLEQPVFLLGIFLTTGYILSLALHKLGVPHIITYLSTGLFLSNLTFKDLNLQHELEQWFVLSEMVALGLIGFKIGTELKLSTIKKEPFFVFIVTIAETGFAFLLVLLLILLFLHNMVLAIILGGLATATAPAATIEVFRKLKVKGDLSTRIKWLLAFDDVVAIIIVEGVLVYLITLVGGKLSILNFLLSLWHEIGISIIIGLIIGFILDLIIEKMRDEIEMMELTLAVLIVTIGLCYFLQTSIIIACMTIGGVATNVGGDNYIKSGDLLEIIMSPILMIFFVLVGAKIRLADIELLTVGIAILYLVGRTAGKLGGAYLGAERAKSPDLIKKNLGMGLLAQGGVSLGLASIVDELLTGTVYESIGKTTVTLIIVSTFFSVTMGSIAAKYAVKQANEIGKAENKRVDCDCKKRHMDRIIDEL